MIFNLKPRSVILIGLSLLLIAYTLYQARALILGPRIWITSPPDGQIVNDPVINIEGRAENISLITLNGRQIFTDETGRWSEKLIVSKGLSIMTVEAKDRFGRETKKTVRIVLN